MEWLPEALLALGPVATLLLAWLNRVKLRSVLSTLREVKESYRLLILCRMENQAMVDMLTNLALVSEKVVAIKESGALSVSESAMPSTTPNELPPSSVQSLKK